MRIDQEGLFGAILYEYMAEIPRIWFVRAQGLGPLRERLGFIVVAQPLGRAMFSYLFAQPRLLSAQIRH